MTNLLHTGIKWVPYINKKWAIVKVKNLFNLSKEKSHEDNPVILSLARSGIKVRDISNNEGQLAANYDGYNPVKIGDLLLNPMDLYSGANCNVSEVSGVISPAYSNLRAKDNINPKFYDYYFKVQYWTMAMFAHGKGVSFDNRWTLNNDGLMNYEVPFINVETQNCIVDFLNKKICDVDKLISIQEMEIEKYNEYRESIITKIVINGLNKTHYDTCNNDNFIKRIPTGWSLEKMVKISSKITDYVASGSFASLAENVRYLDEPDYAMLIRTVDVSGKRGSNKPVYIDKESYDFLSNSNLFGGEIILPNIGASVGDVYLVPNLYEKMSLAPNSIMVLTNQIDKYFYYFFASKVGREKIMDIAQSTAQAKFNKTEFRQLKVLVPPIEEQKEIVSYLDDVCEKINRLIEIKQKKIEKLTEYKKSIIYEYVTGIKEVSYKEVNYGN